MELIHYGATAFNRNLFQPIVNVPWRNKPRGGLWTSPVDAEYGWADWCADNNFSSLEKHFKAKFEGTLYVIDSLHDAAQLPWVQQENGPYWFIDFEDMAEYGAIHLTTKGERETRYTDHHCLYGWDCETVLILNPDSIQELTP